MVGAICRGEAGMAVRRVGCCDCILRYRCRWLGGGVVRWRLRGDWVVLLEYPPRRRSGELEAGLVGG